MPYALTLCGPELRKPVITASALAEYSEILQEHNDQIQKYWNQFKNNVGFLKINLKLRVKSIFDRLYIANILIYSQIIDDMIKSGIGTLDH